MICNHFLTRAQSLQPSCHTTIAVRARQTWRTPTALIEHKHNYGLNRPEYLGVRQLSMQHTARIQKNNIKLRANGFQSLLKLLYSSLKAHSIFFALIAVYVAGAIWATTFVGDNVNYKLPPSSFAAPFIVYLLPILLLAIVTMRFGRLALYVKPKHPISALVKDLKEFLSSSPRLANGLPILIAMIVFIHYFTFVKASLPAIAPFSWDTTFMEWDKWLHFGMHPWQILQPILGYPIVTFAINVIYHLWFIIMWMIWCWLAFAVKNSPLRMQFFLSFMLIWMIGGSLFAISLSSAGPVYYSAIGLSPNPYADLLTYLQEANNSFPIWALDVHKALWDGYTGKLDKFIGISAMPSLHNATALLFAFVGWRTNRTAGIALTIFAGFILIGSVHLAWHYAIDAYLGFIIAGVIWLFSGWFARWYLKTPVNASYAKALAAHETK